VTIKLHTGIYLQLIEANEILDHEQWKRKECGL